MKEILTFSFISGPKLPFRLRESAMITSPRGTVVLVGGYNNNEHEILSDLWELNEDIIYKGFFELNNYQVVIGPSIDGGYYLLGLNKKMPKLFQGIKWGTKSVLRNTINLLNNKPYILPELNDIDTYEDLIAHPSLLKLYKYNFK